MDTENKRRSVVGIYGLITVPPSPDGTLVAADRRHAANLYAMAPDDRRFTFWREVERGATTWTGRDEISTTWNNVNGPSGSWPKVDDVATTWTDVVQQPHDWLPVNETQD